MSRRRAGYGSRDTENPTIRLKARNMSALRIASYPGPRMYRISSLFLGLFGVTRRAAVAGGSVYPGYVLKQVLNSVKQVLNTVIWPYNSVKQVLKPGYSVKQVLNSVK